MSVPTSVPKHSGRHLLRRFGQSGIRNWESYSSNSTTSPILARSCAGRRSAGGEINAASFSAFRLLSGALALAAIHGDVSTTEKNQMTKVGNGASVNPKRGGVVVKAGDRVYIPAGGLRISMDKDGTTSVSASVAVDPVAAGHVGQRRYFGRDRRCHHEKRFPGRVDLRRPCPTHAKSHSPYTN